MAAAETVGILVPTDNIARVIGKQGAGLKLIREQTGCKVQVQQNADQNAGGSRRVDLSGAVDQVCAGFQMLLGKAFTDGTNPSLLIPAEKAGAAVGRGGENLKRIREECHVRITLEREPVVDPATGQQERLLTMQGELEHMAVALRYVLGPGSINPFVLAALPRFPTSAGFPPAAAFAAAAAAAGAAFGTSPMMPKQGVRPPSADPDEIQLHYLVPDRFAGAILGKAGAQVKQTAAAAGCRVSMTVREGMADRRAVIMGGFTQCAAAQEMLYTQLVEAARAASTDFGEVSVVFMVRKEAAGAVIGKQGASLKLIRETSGAKIQLQREEVEGQRPCNISGTLQSVMQAERGIFDIVRQVPVEAGGSAGMGGNGGGAIAGSYGAGAMAGNYGGGTISGNYAADMSVFPPTAKRQRVDEASPATKLLVPALSAGAVIGKQGSGLKEIREMTGVQVEMQKQAEAPQWPNDRVVMLKGPVGSRQAAVNAVLRMAFQGPTDPCILKLLVSPQQAGSIIGKQGATLKRIREQYGINVQVEREEVFGERLVSASGPHNAVAACAATLLTILESSPGTAGAGGAGAPVGFGPPGDHPMMANNHDSMIAASEGDEYAAYHSQPQPGYPAIPAGAPGY